jgi:hypothetical protein
MSVEAGVVSRGEVVCRDFPGLIDNVDPRDLPPGAADVQVNVCCILLGELQVRLGYREVSFDVAP